MCDKIVIHADPDLADLIPGFLENRRKDVLAITAPTHVLYCNLLINIAARQELVRQNISSFYNSLKI
jgi:hypothetical protein